MHSSTYSHTDGGYIWQSTTDSSITNQKYYPVAGTGSADSTPNRIEVNFRSYSPFGEQLGSKVSSFGYNGESYDAATGALYLRARFYEPALNRFSQKDIDRGTVANPKSLNRYLYTWNNPISYVDLDGQRVTLPLNLGGGSSSKKATATKTSVPKPAPKCAPVAFQEQPVSTSASKVQSAVTTAAPAITPAMQKNLAAAAAVGAVSNSMVSSNIELVNSPNPSSLASDTKDQGRSRPSDYSQPSTPPQTAATQDPNSSKVDSPIEEKGSCGKKASFIFDVLSWGSTAITGIGGWINSINASLFMRERNDLLQYAASKFAEHQFGDYVVSAYEKAAVARQAANAAQARADIWGVAGAAVDFALRLMTGESLLKAAAKTAGDFLVGMLATTAATALVAASAPGWAVLGAFGVITVGGVWLVDHAVDGIESLVKKYWGS